MAGRQLICGHATFDFDAASEVWTTPFQGYASSTVEGATLRRPAFHVNGSKRAEWRALANDRKRRRSLGYERQRRFFITNIDVQVRYPPGAPTRLFRLAPKRSQPSAQYSENLEK